MKSLFVCTTPFQVMNSVVISHSLEGPSTLVILDKFKDSNTLCERVKETEIFEDTRLFDDSAMWASRNRSWLLQRLSTVGTYIRCKSLVEKFFPEISTYTDIFVSSRAQVNRLLCMYAAQWLEDVRIHFFDDGLGSYSGSIIRIKGLDRVLRKTLVGKRAVDFTYDLYLYSPELYKAYQSDPKLTVQQICITEEDKKAISEIFHYEEESGLKCQNILFDTIPSDEFTKEGEDVYREIVRRIISLGNVVIKQHPRNREPRYDAPYFENITIPFEVYCANKSFDDATFYTSCSTAVFTPKLLYDQEPRIIFLYKALDDYRKNRNHDCDKLVSCLKKMYRNPEKIIVAGNREEIPGIISVGNNQMQ